ncbi:MAG: GGDEF domain-containing protein [Clostridiales bacterium]|nr:GGDEF domain-containing protein [Clostridiales bacterium]
MKRKVQKKVNRKVRLRVAFIFVFALILAYLWDFEANAKDIETDRSTQMLSDLAVQGATIVENRIAYAKDRLRIQAKMLGLISDLQSDEILEVLEASTKEFDTDFVRLGLVDTEGQARVTDGRILDVSGTTFFKAALKGEEYVSTVVVVRGDEDEGSIAVSVPVLDKDEKVKAVLYGIIQTTEIQLYEDTMWDVGNENQYIHIVDAQGNYIVRSKNKGSMMEGTNLYDGLAKVNPSVPIDEIKSRVKEKDAVQCTIRVGQNVRYVYLAPMKINNWCVVTVLTGNAFEDQISYYSEGFVYLMIKVFLTLGLFGGFCYKTIIKEKVEIEELNKKLSIEDQMFQIAVSEIGSFIFSYDLSAERLEFLNYDEKILKLPRIVENFPETFSKYIKNGTENCLEINALLEAVNGGEDNIEGDFTFVREGKTFIYHVKLKNIADEENRVIRIIGVLNDVTEERQNEKKLKKGEQVRSAVLSDAIGFFEVNLSRDCVMSDGEIKESPFSYSDVLEKFLEVRVKEEYRPILRERYNVKNLLEMYENGNYDFSTEYIRLEENGKELWVVCETHLKREISTDDILALLVVRDINEKKLNELKLEQKAIFDPLTKVYNRGFAVEKINEILETNGEENCAFILLDLDNFKTINDIQGHLAGDQVLVDVANILRHHVRKNDFVCRIGGDEFVVFLTDIPREAVQRNIARLLEKLRLSYEKDGSVEQISASIGITVAPEDGRDFVTLYEKADVVLYEVKKASKDNYRFYEGK